MEIIPKLKGDKKKTGNICRPISLYTLKDRLIISFTNKYFTEIFDKYFYSNSYAFRSVKKIDGKRVPLTHHDAIQAILDYKHQYKGKRLWVSECDISKFYDSVHHSIVKNVFKNLINKVKKDNPDLYDLRAERLFYKFLESYSFVKNVLPYNEKSKIPYWDEKRIPDGSYGWVGDELKKHKYFKSFKNAKIGVPQGGALSGLIANMVLDFADKKVVNSSNSKLLYVRFCDDMVIIHPHKKECRKTSEIYANALKELHLIPHEFKFVSKNNSDLFWSGDIKSKHPYW